jgi:excisionase family DNA binding protein
MTRSPTRTRRKGEKGFALSIDLDARTRQIARQRARQLTRVRDRKLKADRAEAVQTGKAVFISPREAAVLTGMSLDTIYRMIADKRLTARKLGKGKRGGRLLIVRADLLAGAAP